MNTQSYYSPESRRSGGFTLIELLIVIAVIAILAFLAFPVYNSITVKGRSAKCTSNLKQLGSASSLYMAENGTIPMRPGTLYATPTWYVLLADYLGAEPSGNISFVGDFPSVLDCPSINNGLPVNYAPSISCAQDAIGGRTIGGPEGVRVTQLKGSAEKIWLITSNSAYFVNPYNGQSIAFPHNGVGTALYFDGHVESIREAELTAGRPGIMRPFIP